MTQNEIEEIQKAIETLENQRALLGDSVVDTAVAPLHEKLTALEAANRPDQQRKLVTTLFLDVVNSTAMVRDMDPEDHLAIMDGAMQRLTVPIEANGGRVLKYMGDGMMALFGHPVARENDPELAQVADRLSNTELMREVPIPITMEHEMEAYQEAKLQQRAFLQNIAVNLSDYHGGASVGSYICRRSGEQGIEYVSFYAFVPAYDFSNTAQVANSIRIENDYMAWLGIMQRINDLYQAGDTARLLALADRMGAEDPEPEPVGLVEALEVVFHQLGAPHLHRLHAGDREVDARTLEELRSLGYIK